MRLMLGTKDNPSLLVDVGTDFDRTLFNFWVVNGDWEGTFTRGHITIHYGHEYGDYSTLNRVEILCDDHDRLRGDYNDVFNNFDNPEYVAHWYRNENRYYFMREEDRIAFMLKWA